MLMSTELITALVSCLVALAALFGVLSNYFKAKTVDKRLENIERSDLKGLYVICPHCGQRVNLSEVEIFKEASK